MCNLEQAPSLLLALLSSFVDRELWARSAASLEVAGYIDTQPGSLPLSGLGRRCGPWYFLESPQGIPPFSQT